MRLAVLVAALALSGCAVFDGYRAPPVEIGAR
jgi:hypothetical protein